MTVYTSRDEWDTNINSVGGKRDVYLVTSPWSNDPSANSTQGALTSGVLINEFEPPEILIEPATDGYFYQDRMNMGRINSRANTLINSYATGSGGSGSTADTTEDEKVAATVSVATNPTASTADTTAVSTPMPVTTQEAPTTVTTSPTGESYRTALNESYVARSRRNAKVVVNPSRDQKGGKTEKYNPGIPGLVGSNIHQENFTQEQSNNIIIVLLAIIVFCIVGVCFGLLVPQIYVTLKNKNNGAY